MVQTLDDAANDCKQWFKLHYAPLWTSVERLDPAKVRAGYASSFQEYTLEGDVIMHENSIDGWESRFAMYKAGGWSGAEISRVDAYAFGPKHALVEACWKHFGADGSSGLGCNTYVVVGSGASWTISSAMDVECSSQRLGTAIQGNH